MFFLVLVITIITLLIILIIDIIFTPANQSINYNNLTENNNKYENLDDDFLYKTTNYTNFNIINDNNLNEYNEDLEKYIAKEYIMTKTETIFYIELKKITDELNMTIFPQVDLERIIRVKDNNYRDRNRIKSRNIDYTIVKNINYKIVCCIELDDYTHKFKKAQKADKFKNELFKKVKIPLHRIEVSNNYDREKIKKILQQDMVY